MGGRSISRDHGITSPWGGEGGGSIADRDSEGVRAVLLKSKDQEISHQSIKVTGGRKGVLSSVGGEGGGKAASFGIVKSGKGDSMFDTRYA